MTDAAYASLPASVQEVLNQETFDVFEYVTGETTPADTVLIYTNRAAGWDLNKLTQRERDIADLAESDGLSIADEADWVDPAELAAVKERVEAGALTFHLKALAPALKKALRKNIEAKTNFKPNADYEDNEAFYDQFAYELMSRTIVKAVNRDGKVNAPWTDINKIKQLEDGLDESEYMRLYQAVFAINADGDLYEAAVSADFLSKR